MSGRPFVRSSRVLSPPGTANRALRTPSQIGSPFGMRSSVSALRHSSCQELCRADVGGVPTQIVELQNHQPNDITGDIMDRANARGVPRPHRLRGMRIASLRARIRG